MATDTLALAVAAQFSFTLAVAAGDADSIERTQLAIAQCVRALECVSGERARDFDLTVGDTPVVN